jgi:hypothetical protein
MIALSVDSKSGIIKALNQEVTLTVTIRAPGLDRERLIKVIVLPILLV